MGVHVLELTRRDGDADHAHPVVLDEHLVVLRGRGDGVELLGGAGDVGGASDPIVLGRGAVHGHRRLLPFAGVPRRLLGCADSIRESGGRFEGSSSLPVLECRPSLQASCSSGLVKKDPAA